MTRFQKTLLAALASFLAAGAGFAATSSDTQDVTLNIDEVAEITAGANITMTIVGTGVPGTPPANPTDTSSHLQYTSIVDAGLRKVQAKLSVGSAPAGTSLKLTAVPLAGQGTAAGEITLSTTDQDLIGSIGSVATGAGASDGPELDYEWSIDTLSSLDFSNDVTVTVTFTLTAEA